MTLPRDFDTWLTTEPDPDEGPERITTPFEPSVFHCMVQNEDFLRLAPQFTDACLTVQLRNYRAWLERKWGL